MISFNLLGPMLKSCYCSTEDLSADLEHDDRCEHSQFLFQCLPAGCMQAMPCVMNRPQLGHIGSTMFDQEHGLSDSISILQGCVNIGEDT